MRKINLIKVLFLLLFELISNITFGQEISKQLPVISPQSPTTSDLGKYGEVQVNESTGMISPSIPLFEYNAGSTTIPITLNYSGNGVMTNQDPTWTGINWNINPGGVITRQVRDEADELTSYENKWYYSEAELNLLPGSSTPTNHTSVWWHTLLNIENNGIDTEVDIFNYNFLGYSGSFFLDKDLVNTKAHLIKYDKELSITFIPDSGLPSNGSNKSGFMIKTPDGNTYFFGTSLASESSRTWVNNGSGSTAGIPYTQNAFYLYEVRPLNGGVISFEYTQNNSNICSYKIGIQESAKKIGLSACQINTPRTIYKQIENSITLRKISNSFNNQYVEFDTSEINRCAGIYKLNTIYLKSQPAGSSATMIKKIKLNYLIVDKEIDPTKNKFFIEKVEFFNKNNLYEYNYELTYNSPELLPKKESFAQDELGYYNGKDDNTTLLPLNTNVNFNYCYNLADREASLVHAQYGSLTQIKYPTGGTTSFEYELPYKGLQQVYANHFVAAKYRDPYSNYSSSNSTVSGGYTVYYNYYNPPGGETLDDSQARLAVANPVTISGVLHTTAIGYFTHQNKVAIYAVKQVLGQPDQEILLKEHDLELSQETGNPSIDYSFPFSASLSPGNYIFKIAIFIWGSTAINNSVYTNAQLSLPATFRKVYNPGLRIKRVHKHDSNQNIETTRYFYNNLSSLNTENFEFHANYYYVTRELVNSIWTNVYNLTANSLKNVFNTDMGNTYQYVTISYGGDNFENGGKEMRFNKSFNHPPFYYATSAITMYDSANLWSTEYSFDSYEDYTNFIDVGFNDSYQNSVLEKELFINNNQNKIKEINYSYNSVVDAAIHNIKSYTFCQLTKGNIHLTYQTKSYKYRLLSTTTKEFLPSPSNPMVTTTTQTFATDKVSLPSTIETTNSANEVKKLKIYYPSDIATIGNLTPDDAVAIPLLTTKHNLAEIVKTENFVNNDLLESRQISFKNWSGDILPSVIKTKKGNAATTSFEDRVVFHNYNSLGNPTLVSLKDGIKTQYVYNSKQQVVLKIENPGTTLSVGPIDEEIDLPTPPTPPTPCLYQNTYPNAMVTSYTYDPITDKLLSITDPKCNTSYYTYDTFGRLWQVKDSQGNIVSENEYHYKP